METVFKKIISLSFLPIVILNIFGSIVGAVWLIVIGEWKLVLFAFLASVFFPFVYSIVFLIQAPLAGLLYYFIKKKIKFLALVTGFINMLIGHGIDLFWVIIVFSGALVYAGENNPIPYLLFGWEVATGPFQYMASKEPPDSIGSYFAVYLTQISYIILVVFFFLGISIFSLPLIIFITITLEIYLLKTSFQLEEANQSYLNKDSNN